MTRTLGNWIDPVKAGLRFRFSGNRAAMRIFVHRLERRAGKDTVREAYERLSGGTLVAA
jgi:hypothetical protein